MTQQVSLDSTTSNEMGPGALSLQQRDDRGDDVWKFLGCTDNAEILFLRYLASLSDQEESSPMIFSPSNNVINRLRERMGEHETCHDIWLAFVQLHDEVNKSWGEWAVGTVEMRKQARTRHEELSGILWQMVLGSALLRSGDDHIKRTVVYVSEVVAQATPGMAMYFCFPYGQPTQICLKDTRHETKNLENQSPLRGFVPKQLEESDSFQSCLRKLSSLGNSMTIAWFKWLKDKSSQHQDDPFVGELRFISMVWLQKLVGNDTRSRNTREELFSSYYLLSRVVDGNPDEKDEIVIDLRNKYLEVSRGANLTECHVDFDEIVTSAIYYFVRTRKKNMKISQKYEGLLENAQELFPKWETWNLLQGFAPSTSCQHIQLGDVVAGTKFRWSSIETHFVSLVCMALGLWTETRALHLKVNYLHGKEAKNMEVYVNCISKPITSVARAKEPVSEDDLKKHEKMIDEKFKDSNVSQVQQDLVKGFIASSTFQTDPSTGQLHHASHVISRGRKRHLKTHAPSEVSVNISREKPKKPRRIRETSGSDVLEQAMIESGLDRGSYFKDLLRKISKIVRDGVNEVNVEILKEIETQMNIENPLPEQLYGLKNHNYDQIASNIDELAVSLLPADLIEDVIPQIVIGDGNCLYRSFSVLVFGHELFHIEMRVRCLLSMLTNANHVFSVQMLGEERDRHILEDILSFSDTQAVMGDLYTEEGRLKLSSIFAQNVIQLGKWASFVEMAALSCALNTAVRSIYPHHAIPRNCRIRSALNRVAYPAKSSPADSGEILNVMWTITAGGQPNANHFVPCLYSDILLKRDNTDIKPTNNEEEVIAIDSDDSEVQLPRDTEQTLAISDEKQGEDIGTTKSPRSHGDQDETQDINYGQDEETQDPSDPPHGQDEEETQDPSDPTHGQDEEETQDPSDPPHGQDEEETQDPSGPTHGQDEEETQDPSDPPHGQDEEETQDPSDPTHGQDEATSPCYDDDETQDTSMINYGQVQVTEHDHPEPEAASQDTVNKASGPLTEKMASLPLSVPEDDNCGESQDMLSPFNEEYLQAFSNFSAFTPVKAWDNSSKESLQTPHLTPIQVTPEKEKVTKKLQLKLTGDKKDNMQGDSKEALLALAEYAESAFDAKSEDSDSSSHCSSETCIDVDSVAEGDEEEGNSPLQELVEHYLEGFSPALDDIEKLKKNMKVLVTSLGKTDSECKKLNESNSKLQEERDLTRNENYRLSNEIERLQQVNERLRTGEQDMNTECKRLTESNSKLQKERDLTSNENSKLSSEIERLEQANQSHHNNEEDMNNVRQDLEKQTLLVHKMGQKIKDLMDEKDLRCKAHEELEEQFKKLVEQTSQNMKRGNVSAEQDLTIQQLTARVSQQDMEIEKLNHEVDSLVQERDEAREGHQVQSNALEKQLETEKRALHETFGLHMSKLQAELTDKTNKITELENFLSDVNVSASFQQQEERNQQEQLQRQLSEVTQHVEKLTKYKSSIEAECENLRQRLTETTLRLDELETDNNSLGNKLSKAESENNTTCTGLKNEMKKRESHIEKLTSENNKLNDQLSDSEKDKEALKVQLATVQSEKGEAHSEFQTKVKENERLKEQLGSESKKLYEQLSDAETNVQFLRKQLSTLQSEKNEASTELKNRERHIERLSDENNKLNNQLSDTEKDNGTLKRQISTLQAEKSDARSAFQCKIKERDSCIECLNTEASNTEKDRQSLEKQLCMLQEKIIEGNKRLERAMRENSRLQSESDRTCYELQEKLKNGEKMIDVLNTQNSKLQHDLSLSSEQHAAEVNTLQQKLQKQMQDSHEEKMELLKSESKKSLDEFTDIIKASGTTSLYVADVYSQNAEKRIKAENEATRLNLVLEEKEGEIRHLANKCKTQEHQISALKNDANQIKDKNDSLLTKMAELEETNKAQGDKISTLSSTNASLSQTVNKMKLRRHEDQKAVENEFHSLQHTLDLIMSMLNDSTLSDRVLQKDEQDLITNSSGDMGELESELKNVLSRYFIALLSETKNMNVAQEVEKSYRKHTDCLERSLKRVMDNYTLATTTSQQVQNLQSRVVKLQADKDDLKDSQHRLQAKVVKKENLIQSMEDDKAKVDKAYDTAREKITQLLQRLNEKDMQLHQQTTDQENQAAELSAEVASLKSERDQYVQELHQKDQDVFDLKQEVLAKSREIVSLDKRLQEKTKQFNRLRNATREGEDSDADDQDSIFQSSLKHDFNQVRDELRQLRGLISMRTPNKGKSKMINYLPAIHAKTEPCLPKNILCLMRRMC